MIVLNIFFTVQTRRGDLEVLAYNLIQWLGCTLPWEGNLQDVNVVHKSKEEYMDNVPKMIKACFGHKTPPGNNKRYTLYPRVKKIYFFRGYCGLLELSGNPKI